jgi:site-specific recombinase XerD
LDSVDPRTRAQDTPVQPASLLGQFEPLLRRVRESPELSPQSQAKFLDLLDRFHMFLAMGHDVGSLADVTKVHVQEFLSAPAADDLDSAPAAATVHLRRAAVRMLFRFAREAGLEVGDPTLDITVPVRTRRPFRPLTDEEVETCRRASLHTLNETRLPATWALAESTARTAELPFISVSDVSLPSGLVWIHGGSRTHPRRGVLTAWGIQQVGRRLERVRPAGSERTTIIYEGGRGGASGQASASAAIAWTLRRASLAGDPAVRPASVAAWAGRRLFDEGAPIEEVARRLGLRSLDRTATFIGLDRSGQ